MSDPGRPNALRRLLRSFALRTALAIAASALLLSLLGAGWGWMRAETALRQELDLVLAGEAEGLIRDYQAIGAQALLDAARISARRDALLLVLVQTADGQALAGHLDGAPTELRGFATLHVPGQPTLRAVGAMLPGGINLVVAARLSAAEDAARALAWTPLIAAFGAGGLALLLGLRRGTGARTPAGLRVRRGRAGDRGRSVAPSAAIRTGRRIRPADRDGERHAGPHRVVDWTPQRQVTDDIAHDLRGPLQRLRQTLEGALPGAADDTTLPLAIAELDGVLDTFAALLRIARAEAGAGTRQELDLSALVTTLAEAYAPVVEEAGRSFTTDIVPGVHLRGDPALLQRMLANLLDNALAHGAGAMRVSLRRGPVLVVADDGPGVPAAEHDAVLRRFVRLDRSRGTPGTGLGLALVKAAAQAHRGTVQLGPTRPDGGGLEVRIDLSGP